MGKASFSLGTVVKIKNKWYNSNRKNYKICVIDEVIKVIKAVIFDMDGLMFDTIPIWDKVMVDLLKAYGAEFTTEVKANVYSVRQDECVKYFIERFSIPHTPEYLMGEMGRIFKQHAKSVEAMPGLYELLDYLEEVGIEKTIATTSLRKDVTVLVSEIKDRFVEIVCGDDVLHPKPAPDSYLETMRRRCYLPEECISLEDSMNGVRSGKAAGCFTIAIPNEHSKEVDFSGVADLVVKDLTKVIDVIDEKLNMELG
ncbi:MAG: hypothetical protein A2Y24_06800 [Clostridiales bacterium GWE2_32_10]|nr:MAG: hypothetical protein A2Y24_06800 [Clostridiales bacterium GWE2_32_10]HBY19961.1 hypothetical protein [Clostridiales bacterium]